MSTLSVARQAHNFISEPTQDVLPSGILGTGSALPERRVSNSDLAQFLDTSDDWIVERVGVRTRYIAGPEEGTVQLGCEAARQALNAAKLSAEAIDLIVVATVTPDTPLPSTAACIQNELGASGALAFDIGAACSGFLFAITVADGLLKAHGFSNALVIGAETLSRTLDWTDRTTCVLFGDGAGAVVLSAEASMTGGAGKTEPSFGIIGADLCTDGDRKDFICRPGNAFPMSTLPESICAQPENKGSPYVQMKGRETFKMAVSGMVSSIENVLKKTATSIDDIDLFIPHQSNKRIIDAVYKKLPVKDKERVVVNIDRIANTSAASIPIAFDEVVRAGRAKRGDLVLLTAVGAGMTYGSVLLRC